MTEHGNQLMTRLIGEMLSSVTFVMDYIQLGFGGPVLNVITLPAVLVAGKRFTFGDAGFRDALCNQIGRTVRAAFLKEGESAHIVFDDGAQISVSLRPEDYRSAEALIYYNGRDWWVV